MNRKDLPPEDRRSVAYYDMVPSMQEVAKKYHARMRLANLRDLLFRHAIGRMLHQIAAKPGIYGPDAIRQFAEYLGIPGGMASLVDMKSFAHVFTRQFVREQAEKPLANGAFLTYEHFLCLMKMWSWKERNQLLDRIRAEGLTAAQVRREVAKSQRRQPLPNDED